MTVASTARTLARRLTLVTAVAVLLTLTLYSLGASVLPGSTAADDDGHLAPADTTPAGGTEEPEPSAPADDPEPAPVDEPVDEPAEPEPPAEPELVPGPALLSPGDEGDDVRDLQARLRQIDWFAHDVTGLYGDVTTEAVRGFQAKREIPVTGEVDRRTLRRLYGMTSTPTDDELHNRTTLNGNTPGALDPRCATGRVLCIDKSSRTLRWVNDGKVVTTLDVRFGSEYTPTREGVFSVGYKSPNHVSSIYHTPMPLAMFFSGGQAVHYSSDFAAVGYSGASHGCVNVRDYDALAALFDEVQVGDKVVVYWS